MCKGDQSKTFWPAMLTPKMPISKPNLTWKLGSSIIVPAVGVLSKIWTDYLNNFRIINHNIFTETIARNYNDGKNGLMTLANHNSCLDDPLLWGALMPFKWHLNSSRSRWSAAARDICFTETLHSLFFALGKTFPISRGGGIYQPAMDFAMEILKENGWLHMFPQGRVVEDTGRESDSTHDFPVEKPIYELKWGTAKLIMDIVNMEPHFIEVLPFYHLGMDSVLPNTKPYVPRVNKKVTIHVRESPIIFDRHLLERIFSEFKASHHRHSGNFGDPIKRMAIMEFLEGEMRLLKLKAQQLHTGYQGDHRDQVPGNRREEGKNR